MTVDQKDAEIGQQPQSTRPEVLTIIYRARGAYAQYLNYKAREQSIQEVPQDEEARLGETLNALTSNTDQICDNHWQYLDDDANSTHKEYEELKQKLLDEVDVSDPEKVVQAMSFVRNTIGAQRSWSDALKVVNIYPEILQDYTVVEEIATTLLDQMRLQGPREISGDAETLLRKLVSEGDLSSLQSKAETLRFATDYLDGYNTHRAATDKLIQIGLDIKDSILSPQQGEQKIKTELAEILPDDLCKLFQKYLADSHHAYYLHNTGAIPNIKGAHFGEVLGGISHKVHRGVEGYDGVSSERARHFILGYVESFLRSRPSASSQDVDRRRQYTEMSVVAAKILNNSVGEGISVLEFSTKKTPYAKQLTKIYEDMFGPDGRNTLDTKHRVIINKRADIRREKQEANTSAVTAEHDAARNRIQAEVEAQETTAFLNTFRDEGSSIRKTLDAYSGGAITDDAIQGRIDRFRALIDKANAEGNTAMVTEGQFGLDVYSAFAENRQALLNNAQAWVTKGRIVNRYLVIAPSEIGKITQSLQRIQETDGWESQPDLVKQFATLTIQLNWMNNVKLDKNGNPK